MSTSTPLSTVVKSALSPPILVDSLKTGLFVGLILNLINQGHVLFDDAGISWGGVLLNFIVPFRVSAYSRAHTCGLRVRN